MANSTGEGKGLSAEQVRLAAVYSCHSGIYDWNEMAERLNALLAAQPADSALRLKLEKLVEKWRTAAETPTDSYNVKISRLTLENCADELSTLLTEESSQVNEYAPMKEALQQFMKATLRIANDAAMIVTRRLPCHCDAQDGTPCTRCNVIREIRALSKVSASKDSTHAEG
jgi:hypothetical protein